MKVGTDGTLLGAWAPVEQAQNGTILDVGTGSGLIALMLAQRCPEATILGIDADEAAALQAAENFALSKWSDRLTAKHISLQQLAQDETYSASFDLIVSNPPYFVDSLKNPDATRRTARHTDSLSFAELLDCSQRLLKPNGTLALILPAEAEQTLLTLASQRELSPYTITRVHTRTHKPAKRILLALQNSPPKVGGVPEGGGSMSDWVNKSLTTNTLILQDESGTPRSAAYQNLCKDFYL